MDGLLKAPSASIEARIAFTEDFFRKSNLSLPMALAAGRSGRAGVVLALALVVLDAMTTSP
jgi:hypothetical protein